MSIAQQGANVRTIVASQAVMVAIHAKGLRIATPGGKLPLNVGLAELELLERVGSGPVRFDLTDGVVGDDGPRAVEPGFVDRMVRFGLLLEVGEGGEDHQMLTAAELPSAPDAAGEPELAIDRGAELILVLPRVVRLTGRGFEALDHDGICQLVLSALELVVLARFNSARTMGEVDSWQQHELGERALTPKALDVLVRRARSAGVLELVAEHRLAMHQAAQFERGSDTAVGRLIEAVEDDLKHRNAEEAERRAATGVARTAIIPIHDNLLTLPPLSLGMIFAYIEAHEGGSLTERYRVLPDWIAQTRSPELVIDEPAIFLVSNYIWSTRKNLDVAEALKQANPGHIMIHGGPDTPKYEGDVEQFFAQNPHVDIAVHGEGEVTTAALLEALVEVAGGHEQPDLSVLRDVPGLSYRDGDHVIRTADRDRLTDLDIIPSPYLTGIFDAYGAASIGSAVIESNRGCPYGCTFCDWGSATASRIRFFSLDRVFEEIEWCGRHKIAHLAFADANFGITARDVEIAAKVAETKNAYDFPKHCGTNYAKNTIKYHREIVQLWNEAGILSWGILSLQSMDEGTLDAIQRSNIKTDKYDELAREFRKAGMPLYVDLMIGLPGSTQQSFRNDLQGCVDREVLAKIHETTVLVNSPMNEPAYKEEHRIETSSEGTWGTPVRILSTRSFTRHDRQVMLEMRRMFMLFENFGVLRHVGRYVHQEVGMREVDLYERVRDASRSATQWPLLSITSRFTPSYMAPPTSWKLWIDEVHRFVVDELELADDDALRTVLAVQHALLPAPGRQFPLELDLPHDYAAWHSAIITAKDDGIDWTTVVPRLRDLPPARFVVDDPANISSVDTGFNVEGSFMDSWELSSPVMRASTFAADHSAAD